MGEIRKFKLKEQDGLEELGNVLRLLQNVWLSFLNKDEDGLNRFHVIDVVEGHVLLAVPLENIDKLKKDS